MSNARTNNSEAAEIDFDPDEPWRSGTFKNVWEGVYIEGSRKGQACVSKEFKTGSVYEDLYFEQELSILNRAQAFIDNFDFAGILPGKSLIVLNTPEIWTVDEGKRKVLIEPMIENYEKFNTNTGWVQTPPSFPWDPSKKFTARGEAMQALSHFSYHNSYGQLLLCDLQGGQYRNEFALTDPVIMSQFAKSWGPADLGPDGIGSFFRRHRCGRFCDRTWLKPKMPFNLLPVHEGTSMSTDDSEGPKLPTRESRAPLSQSRKIPPIPRWQ